MGKTPWGEGRRQSGAVGLPKLSGADGTAKYGQDQEQSVSLLRVSQPSVLAALGFPLFREKRVRNADVGMGKPVLTFTVSKLIIAMVNSHDCVCSVEQSAAFRRKTLGR